MVRAYEYGLTRLVARLGLRSEVGWSQEELGLPAHAHTPLQGWKRLREAGFPFVKRMLVTAPQLADRRAAVEQEIADHLPQP